MAVAQLKDTVFVVQNRRDAISALAAQDVDTVRVEQDISPLIHRAASELIMRDDKGQKTDISSVGLPHIVLQDVAGQLQGLGVSAFTSHHILEALEGYTVGLGADFAREAQAKPLYARIVVTDKKPDDLPACELVQTTLIDGQRRVGDMVGQRVMQATIYGTRTSMTREMNLDEMLSSSKKKWLLIYYGSPTATDIQGLSQVDINLINLTQGMGNLLPPDDLKKLEEMVIAGTAQAGISKVIEDFRNLQELIEPVTLGTDILPTIRTDIETLGASIQQQLQVLVETSDIPLATVTILQNVFEKFHVTHQLPIPERALFTRTIAANDESYNIASVREMVILLEGCVKTISPLSEQRSPLEKIIEGLKNENARDLTHLLREAQASLIQLAVLPDIRPATYAMIADILPLIPAVSADVERRSQLGAQSATHLLQTLESVQAVLKAATARGEQVPAIAQSIADQLNRLDIILQKDSASNTPEKRLEILLQHITHPSSAEASRLLQSIVLNLSTPSVQQALITTTEKMIGTEGVVKTISLESLRETLPNMRQFPHEQAILIDRAMTQTMVRDIELKLALATSTTPVTDTQSIQPFAKLPDDPVALTKMLEALKQGGVAELIRLESVAPQTSPFTQAVESLLRNQPQLAEIALTAQVMREIEQTFERTGSKVLNNDAMRILKEEGVAGLVLKADSSAVPSPYESFLHNLRQNPTVVESLVTVAVVRDIEGSIVTQSNTNAPQSSATIELQRTLDVLRTEGVSGLVALDVEQSPATRELLQDILRGHPEVASFVVKSAVEEAAVLQHNPKYQGTSDEVMIASQATPPLQTAPAEPVPTLNEGASSEVYLFEAAKIEDRSFIDSAGTIPLREPHGGDTSNPPEDRDNQTVEGDKVIDTAPATPPATGVTEEDVQKEIAPALPPVLSQDEDIPVRDEPLRPSLHFPAVVPVVPENVPDFVSLLPQEIAQEVKDVIAEAKKPNAASAGHSMDEPCPITGKVGCSCCSIFNIEAAKATAQSLETPKLEKGDITKHFNGCNCSDCQLELKGQVTTAQQAGAITDDMALGIS